MKTLKIITTLFLLISAVHVSAQSKKKEVYRTKKGEHYHKKDCWVIKKRDTSSIPLATAIKRGLQPCRVCYGNKKKNEIIKEKSTNKTKKSSKSTSTRCTGITKKGTRCKRMTKSADGTCWQH